MENGGEDGEREMEREVEVVVFKSSRGLLAKEPWVCVVQVSRPDDQKRMGAGADRADWRLG
jgi:hypothetical protein